MSTTTKSGKKSDTQMITDIKAADAALKANVDPNLSIGWGGETFTIAAIEGQMEGLVSIHDEVNTNKAAYAASVLKWKDTRPEAKVMWETYVSWVEATYGTDPATKKKFGIPVPAPKPTLTAEQLALRNAKLRATAQKKKAAKAAAATSPLGTIVAYDASGNVIGGAPPASVANAAAPAAPAAAEVAAPVAK